MSLVMFSCKGERNWNPGKDRSAGEGDREPEGYGIYTA